MKQVVFHPHRDLENFTPPQTFKDIWKKSQSVLCDYAFHEQNDNRK